MAKRNQKYSSELEKIKLLKSINSMLKTSDIENVLLSNSSKDSEIVSESTIDNLLSKATSNRNTYNDISTFEKESMQIGTYKQPRSTSSKKRAERAVKSRAGNSNRGKPQKAKKAIRKKTRKHKNH